MKKKRTTVVLMALVLVCVLGCSGLQNLWPEDPRAQLALAMDTYALSLRTASDLYDAGYLTQSDMQRIAAASIAARAALDAWELALEQDRDPVEARARFDRAMSRIHDIVAEGGGDDADIRDSDDVSAD